MMAQSIDCDIIENMMAPSLDCDITEKCNRVGLAMAGKNLKSIIKCKQTHPAKAQ